MSRTLPVVGRTGWTTIARAHVDRSASVFRIDRRRRHAMPGHLLRRMDAMTTPGEGSGGHERAVSSAGDRRRPGDPRIPGGLGDATGVLRIRCGRRRAGAGRSFAVAPRPRPARRGAARHGRSGNHAAAGEAAARGADAVFAARPTRRPPTRRSPSTSSWPGSAAVGSSPSERSSAWPPTSRAGAARCST